LQVNGHVICSAVAATHALLTLFVFPRVFERAFQGLGRPAAGEPAAEVDVLGDGDPGVAELVGDLARRQTGFVEDGGRCLA
jgi:hypothetical protein